MQSQLPNLLETSLSSNRNNQQQIPPLATAQCDSSDRLRKKSQRMTDRRWSKLYLHFTSALLFLIGCRSFHDAEGQRFYIRKER
ncbi:hypothetical protein I7I50_00302 [Histoplasma capsulatum G186AR]|uniref:Uncharacterized protein n=1 Tax=Ajellomyces capsulatus TaxID=5037 RepID=A0A8H8CTX2_AJECA|nr:hypothetical protein I7I52_07570 [Histoplasma capsulatum]QSS72449.1 hypothetical protein I7I50_00302 [Histoplasma capsulatum G186AR]